MNSLNPELRWQLSQHMDEVENNDDIWLAVITGAGERAFCAGADLKHRALFREATAEQKAQPKPHQFAKVAVLHESRLLSDQSSED